MFQHYIPSYSGVRSSSLQSALGAGIHGVNGVDRSVVAKIAKIKGLEKMPVERGVQDPGLDKMLPKGRDHSGMLGE